MVTQNVSSKKVTPLMGVLIVAAIAATLILASFLGRIAGARFGTLWGQIVLLLVTGLAAFYVMRYVIIEFQYTVSGEVFYIERVYGKRSKVLIQIPLEDILFVGEREKAVEKWPNARNMITATVRGNENACTTVAYRLKGVVNFAIIQPNDEIKSALFDVEKRARLAKEKWGD